MTGEIREAVFGSIMPQFSLISDDDQIASLAPFKVLAVMCHPSDLPAREGMLATIQAGTRVERRRRRELSPDLFLKAVKNETRRGALAGGLLLTLLQLDENGVRPSLNKAMPLVREFLEPWRQDRGSDWSAEDHLAHIPTRRSRMLTAFKEFHSVSHLWAALLHGQQSKRSDIWPGANKTLPRFLAYGEAFAKKGCRLKWPGGDRRYTLDRAKLWRFALPRRFQEQAEIEALPLNERQCALLREQT